MNGFTFAERLARLRETKEAQTAEKQEVIGAMNHDDWALILPPPSRREVVQTMSTSGMPITDCLLAGFEAESNHPSGGFFGPQAVGANFRRLLEAHPPYVNPDSALAGGYMVNFNSYRKPGWNPDLDYAHLREAQARYQLGTGIGATQHFCQDLDIGLELGWGGILEKIRHYRERNGPSDFYDGLEDVVLGIQDWMGRTAAEAERLAEAEPNPERRANLEAMAAINHKLVTERPQTFREACQWILWFQITARMYNGSGSLGRLDLLLLPYYEKESARGTLTDEEAIFYLACLLLGDTAYIQLGGPAPDGRDATNPLSFLVLEAAHRLKIPANVGVSVGREVDSALLRRAAEILFQDKLGIPKFLGSDAVVEGFARNGYPLKLARQRAYAGCHWYGLPGREYTLMDCVKINLGRVFEVAWEEMMADGEAAPSVDDLWDRFATHLETAVATIAQGLDYHLEHMHKVFPELVLDLCCHGPIERGLDASHGGVDHYNMCVDAAALATVADSFAALVERVQRQGTLSWEAIDRHVASDWAGPEGERARLLMSSVSRYGSGGSLADDYAVQIAELFTCLVKAKPTPEGRNMIPGIFSWANTIAMGANLGATPNGRHAGNPISHGANPDPGFAARGGPTHLALAVAAVQPGYGNTAPLQLDMDPGVSQGADGIAKVEDLIRTHFELGGTQINLNVVDKAQILAAHEHPSRYPDLIVRVTGFSAYFASLSPEFRQLVVDRIVTEGG
jgi:formate C-acetyltransferase